MGDGKLRQVALLGSIDSLNDIVELQRELRRLEPTFSTSQQQIAILLINEGLEQITVRLQAQIQELQHLAPVETEALGTTAVKAGADLGERWISHLTFRECLHAVVDLIRWLLDNSS